MLRLLLLLHLTQLSNGQALDPQTVSFEEYSASDAVEYYPGTNSIWLKGAGSQVRNTSLYVKMIPQAQQTNTIASPRMPTRSSPTSSRPTSCRTMHLLCHSLRLAPQTPSVACPTIPGTAPILGRVLERMTPRRSSWTLPLLLFQTPTRRI